MASEMVCGLIFRLLLPVCLAAACLFRYNVLSFVYLIYLLLIPLFAEPTKTTMQGHTGRLLKSLCFTSLTFLLLHIIYQITINSLLAGDNIEPNFNCSSWEKSIRQLGFESVRGADAGNGIRVFIPDIGMFIAGLVTWLLCRSLEKPPGKDVLQHSTDFHMGNQPPIVWEGFPIDFGAWVWKPVHSFTRSLVKNTDVRQGGLGCKGIDWV